MFKYILFDFDGTLVDTNELIIYSLSEAARKFTNRIITREDLNSVLGRYLEDQMKLLSPEHYKEMINFYREFYKEHQDQMTKEFPGIKQMLQGLKNNGCKIAVVSAKGRGGIEHSLEKFNLADYIDVIISAYDVQNNKPHPEPALKALEALNAVCDKTLIVGDSPYDILCGKNAGIKTVLVDWTIFPKHELLKLGPDYVIKTPEELIKIVARAASE